MINNIFLEKIRAEFPFLLQFAVDIFVPYMTSSHAFPHLECEHPQSSKQTFSPKKENIAKKIHIDDDNWYLGTTWGRLSLNGGRRSKGEDLICGGHANFFFLLSAFVIAAELLLQ